jgi:molecular chaperone GrpE (heat shock protein)
LEDFRTWLDELAPAEIPETGKTEAQKPDLLDFFGELGALRQDMRLSAKAVRDTNEGLGRVGAQFNQSLAEGMQGLDSALREVKTRIPQARREGLQAAALELVATVEGLERCALNFQDIPVRGWLGLKNAEKLRGDLLQPLNLVLAKSRDSLDKLKIKPLAQVGQPFETATMRAIAAGTEGKYPAGTVSKVCRQGYTINGDVLVTAEVKVEK